MTCVSRNDNSYNESPPDYVCLLCLHPAKEGSVSQVMSVATVHQALQERFPELMDRLHQPFWYDRHAEHVPDEPSTFAAPIFERASDGTVKARLALSEIFAGYELRGERLDNKTAAAAAVQSVFDQPELRVELDFARARSSTSTIALLVMPGPSSSITRTRARTSPSSACGCATSAGAAIAARRILRRRTSSL